jgi:hypothetical protein
MKKPTKWILTRTAFVSCMLISFNSHALLKLPQGVNSSGGAKALVCRGHNGVIKSVELLDLFEAKQLYRLNVSPLGNDFESSIRGLEAKLATLLQGLSIIPMDHWIQQAIDNQVLVDSELEPVDDANSPIKPPPGCSFEQLALYYKTDAANPTLWVNQAMWDKMDTTNRAAMIAHEAVYEVARGQGDTDSMRSRKIVGHLFSDFAIAPVMEGIPETARDCYAAKGGPLTARFGFVLYDDPNDSRFSVLQFNFVRGRFPFAKVAAHSFKWPWRPDAYNMVTEMQSTLENFESLDIIQEFDANGEAEYYFNEADGRYKVHCKNHRVKQKR